MQHYKLYNDEALTKLYDNLLKRNTKYHVYDVNLTYDLTKDEFKDLIDLKDEINFRGNIYKLDSILLQDQDSRHVIAGITCGNEKYVYNGWNKQTNDPSLTSDKTDYVIEPCKLMKYDWNIRNGTKFCLNVKDCKLDDITDKQQLCFSFDSGYRLLIYVKVSQVSSPALLSSSFKSFSPNAKENLKQILKEEIDKLLEVEIDKRLEKINPNNIKLPLILKRKIVLYNLYDKNRIKHNHINDDIVSYVHSTFDIDKFFQKAKSKLGHFYLPEEINKDIFRINFYVNFQLDLSKYHENIYDIIKTKLKLTPITDLSNYKPSDIMNIDGKNYNIQTLFYYYFIVHLENTYDDIINNKIKNISDLKKIYESQISIDEFLKGNEGDILYKLRFLFKINKNINQIFDYKLLIKLYGIQFFSLYLINQNKSLQELTNILQNSNETVKGIYINIFNSLKLLPNNITRIEELIQFLNKEYKK